MGGVNSPARSTSATPIPRNTSSSGLDPVALRPVGRDKVDICERHSTGDDPQDYGSYVRHLMPITVSLRGGIHECRNFCSGHVVLREDMGTRL